MAGWQAVVVLTVLMLSTTALGWKGILSSHAVVAILSMIGGSVVPHAASALAGRFRRDSRSSFSEVETPTRPDVLSSKSDKPKA